MSNEVLVFVKGWIDLIPPALTLAHALRTLQKDVVCVCSACREQTRADLESAGIQVVEVCRGLADASSKLDKLRHYAAFRRGAWEAVDSADEDALLWVFTIDTAMALGRRLLSRRYVQNLKELHDRSPQRYRTAIRRYARHARRVVVPEASRAAILRCWYGLDRTPAVLPNRPLSHPRHRDLPIGDKNAAEILRTVDEGQKIVLYQGSLAKDRDLTTIARGIHELGRQYRFVLMGRDLIGHLQQLRRLCPDLIHIPWVVPPTHLEITSHAHVGIAAYAYDSLNSVFCAPNKIWEYTGFAIPMLCQDLPGLRFTIGASGAGVCTSMDGPRQVVDAVDRIENDYAGFSRRATEFYESIDNASVIAQVIADADSG
ncbi:MAG: hypothetical protein JXB62_05320 [Pirellulales bacterium]|nr:hypothetical protein [Pirellulales bacterium]